MSSAAPNSPTPTRAPLDPARLGPEVLPPGWRVEVVDSSPSTNADVAARAAAGEAEGLVLVTEHQTAGRGRLDRVWTTPPRACLTFSVLLRPDVPLPHWPWLPLLTGYAVWSAVREHTTPPVSAGLKWPNDVLLDDAKVCGILVERHDAAAVVGIGLNVDLTADELPVPTATSLALALDRAPEREDLLRDVVGALARGYDAWRAAPGGARQRAAYARACVTLGRRVRVELPSAPPLHGTAVDVDADGRLVVDDGTAPVAVGAGDVVHVRAEGRAAYSGGSRIR